MEFDIGKHCSEPSCKQLDFLPFKCTACQKIFCLDHRTFGAHSCPHTNPLKDRRALDCPLCGEIIASPPNQDPNIKMDEHIRSKCKIMNPNLNARPTNQCSVPGCKKKELLPVTCSKCSRQFCLNHRWERDHQCPALKKVQPTRQQGPFKMYTTVKS